MIKNKSGRESKRKRKYSFIHYFNVTRSLLEYRSTGGILFRFYTFQVTIHFLATICGILGGSSILTAGHSSFHLSPIFSFHAFRGSSTPNWSAIVKKLTWNQNSLVVLCCFAKSTMLIICVTHSNGNVGFSWLKRNIEFLKNSLNFNSS